MIRESLYQGKAYPMNSCERTNRNFWKSEHTLGSEIWKLTPSKTECNESMIGTLRLHLRDFN
jgi:hypothetical protein